MVYFDWFILIPGFVFGVNLTDRVITPSSKTDDTNETKEDENKDSKDSEEDASSSQTEQTGLKEIEV